MTAKPAAHTAPGALVIINPAYRWREDGNLHYVGRGHVAGAALSEIDSNLTPSLYAEQVSRTLFAQKNFGSGILTTGNTTTAWVDHIRAYPVYYTWTGQGVIVSNDARAILHQLGKATPDKLSALEFAMAGYVTGQDTLYEEIKSLRPGEFLIAGNGSAPIVARYYRYFPAPDESKGRREAQQELSGIIDDVMEGIIGRAAGRPIWVPLSAGLDSRIILCKLHEFGYKNLHTFTYGPRFNFEALYAKKIARQLGVPWHFIGLGSRECADMFADKTRRAYVDFADGLKAAPSMREYTALLHLKSNKILHDNAIIINGQSGDYISGGHVAERWFEEKAPTQDDFCKVIVAKHYDLWKDLKSPENIDAVFRKIQKLIPELSRARTSLEFAAIEECWEFDERQATLVVNGQRSYDFFGYDWELPLWERTLCDFFACVPYDLKRGQSLFKQYLKSYNYKGLFPQKEPHLWRWPVPMLWVVPVAKIIGLFSRDAKKNFYNFMKYYGHYSNQYAFFPIAVHKRIYLKFRNIFSLYVRNWFIENKFPISADLKKGMMIDG